MQMNKLLPCPYCGFEMPAIIRKRHGSFLAECGVCNAKSRDFRNKAEVIEYWNRRTIPEGYVTVSMTTLNYLYYAGKVEDKKINGWKKRTLQAVINAIDEAESLLKGYWEKLAEEGDGAKRLRAIIDASTAHPKAK